MHILIIDPQYDFMDVDGAALPVPGACADMERLSQFLCHKSSEVRSITVTLDSHHAYGIERPGFWCTKTGELLRSFDEVTLHGVESGEITTCNPAHRDRAVSVLKEMTEKGNHTLRIWPQHCVVGTKGHTVDGMLSLALQQWELRQRNAVEYVLKGTSPWTEHYGAFEAEVHVMDDTNTWFNHNLMTSLQYSALQGHRIVVAGEASSHCVKATVEQLVKSVSRVSAKSVTLLTDCMSPVPGCEQLAKNFFMEMETLGVTLCTAMDLLGHGHEM